MQIPPLPDAGAAVERLGRYAASSQVVGAIRTAASATGVSFDVLAAKAAMESSFRPDAQAATSSARGLFQFTEQTWLSMVQQHGAEHGLGAEAGAILARSDGRLTVADPVARSRILALRDDPELSARLAGEYVKEISDSLTPVLGRRPDAAELYLGHFLGAGGATRMLQALANTPDRAASEVLPAAAAANRRMFTDAEGQPLSAAQFMAGIRSRLGRVQAGLGLTTPAGPLEFQPNTAVATTRSRPGEAGGWGNGSPQRVAQEAERAMISNLSRVFARMSRLAGQEAGEPGERGIPAAVLSAMREASKAPVTGQAEPSA